MLRWNFRAFALAQSAGNQKIRTFATFAFSIVLFSFAPNRHSIFYLYHAHAQQISAWPPCASVDLGNIFSPQKKKHYSENQFANWVRTTTYYNFLVFRCGFLVRFPKLVYPCSRWDRVTVERVSFACPPKNKRHLIKSKYGRPVDGDRGNRFFLSLFL